MPDEPTDQTPPTEPAGEPPADPPKDPDDTGTPTPPPTEPTAGEGEPDPEPTTLEETKKVLKAITEQNVKLDNNIKRAEKLQADALLNGQIPAGREQTKEDKDIESARKLLKGTGYEDELFPQS